MVQQAKAMYYIYFYSYSNGLKKNFQIKNSQADIQMAENNGHALFQNICNI